MLSVLPDTELVGSSRRGVAGHRFAMPVRAAGTHRRSWLAAGCLIGVRRRPAANQTERNEASTGSVSAPQPEKGTLTAP